jgi:hypothetical protein
MTADASASLPRTESLLQFDGGASLLLLLPPTRLLVVVAVRVEMLACS